MKKYLFFIFVFIASLLGFMPTSAAVVNYTADNTTIFPNPERGFTEELGGETMLSDANNHVIQPEADWYFDMTDPDNADRKTQSLLLAIYYLGNYRSQDLSNAILTGFNEDMQILRNKGFKCVLRFAYDWNSGDDADLTWVKRHIQQLKPYLAANADVIYVLQTGFVGQWGEWYYSSHFGNKTQELTPERSQILAAMIDACPQDRFLLVRYPLIKLSYLGDEVPLTSEQAFTGTDRARIGHHNDAFMNAWGDMGTYGRNGNGPDDDPILRQYIADETLYVPNGGETNLDDDNTLATQVSQMTYTMNQLSTYHWSFCGSTYAEMVTDKWRANGTYAEMDRRLGYRYQLVSATLPDQAAIGGTANINIQIKNVGCAPLYNERHAYLVLKNGNNKYSVQLQSDPRRWLPNGELTVINEQITIPSSVPAGTYQLYLHLPDKYASLASDPRFAVRFANTGVWDATTGMNDLGASITIVSSGTVIPTTPTISVAGDIAFGDVTVGTEATQQLAVWGNDLEAPVFITSNNAALTVNPTSLTPNEVQSAISVTLTLNATTAGSGSATLTLTSTNAATQTVNVTWTAAASGGGETPGPSTGGSVIFYWQNGSTSAPSMNSSMNASVGTMTAKTTDNSKSWSVEDMTYASSVSADMKATVKKGVKFGANALYVSLEPSAAAGTFKTGDTIYICGYNSMTISAGDAHDGSIASGLATGSSKTACDVNYVVIGSGVNASSINIQRTNSSGTGITAIKVVRPSSGGSQGGETPDPPVVSAFTIDGNFSDWSDVTGVTGSAGLYDMRWYANSTDIYFYLEFDATTGPIDILLDTDNNSATGHEAWMWTNAGADWLIEGESDDFANAGLSSFDNSKPKDDWDNGWVLTSITDFMTVSSVVTLSNGHKAIEGKISMSKLGTVSGLKVGAFTSDVNWNDTGHLPSSESLLAVPINTTPTGIDQITNHQSQITNHKLLHDGVLYILRDGKIYNAQGALITR